MSKGPAKAADWSDRANKGDREKQRLKSARLAKECEKEGTKVPLE
jgi:hypothetical protein